MGQSCGAHTFPYIESSNKSAIIEHEATTSKIMMTNCFIVNKEVPEEEAIGNLMGIVKMFYKNYPWNLLLRLKNY